MTHHLQHLPHDARSVLFTGAKGGVGTSTVAALHALALARAGFPTTLTAISDVQLGDLAALLGIPAPEEPVIDVNATTAIVASATARPAIVIDGGTHPAIEITASEHYLVTRPCYLALKRAVEHPRRAQGVVLIAEPQRSLTRADIEDVLGLPVVATLEMSAAMARHIDAGLLAVRDRRHLRLRWHDTDPVSPST